MERPKKECWAADVLIKLLVSVSHDVGYSRDIFLDVFLAKSVAFDEIKHHHAWLGVSNLRRQANCSRCFADFKLTVTDHMMSRHIAPKARDEACGTVDDLEADIA
ncbi:hypothetical protein GCM10010869_05440 [Mesorhizobium tianshanense]|nr:hypothetical protein GCM10010869_05440 [Mesorhizobium tianshanense]